MLSRKGREITPDDVAAAVLSQGADETRKELVRLMAEPFGSSLPVTLREVCTLAWTLEETARSLPA
jgi:hypothetical protein